MAAVRRLLTADNQALPNAWTTTDGHRAETYLAATIPGRPQRYGWRLIDTFGNVLDSSPLTFTRRRSARRAMAQKYPPAVTR